MRVALKVVAAVGAAALLVWACPFDDTLRPYLRTEFWLPFTKDARALVRAGVPRSDEPFAGMRNTPAVAPLARLRAEYQAISQPEPQGHDTTEVRAALAAAKADASLTTGEREEVALIAAKIEMRAYSPANPQSLNAAREALGAFLPTAQSPVFRSEARGWLAYVHYLAGERVAAAKIYLDELNRPGANVSIDSLLTSLYMLYGRHAAERLAEDVDAFFDTPEHAAFAIQTVTNREWRARVGETNQRLTYDRLRKLIEKHAGLLRTEAGAKSLALLSMRTALYGGDPAAAIRLAEQTPGNSAVRAEPDFQWMLGSSYFLAKRYADAERPLLALVQSKRAALGQKAAAASGLCGVYRKLGNTVEQIRWALWLQSRPESAWGEVPFGYAGFQDIYWAPSGFDLGLLLDTEAPLDAIEAFLATYPKADNIRVVKYSLAVRLARLHRYEEAARMYDGIHPRRAARMRKLATLHAAATTPQGKFAMAEYISENTERLYFNDALWAGLQRYATRGEREPGFTRAERERQIQVERELKDGQEEFWQAHLLLREVVREEGATELGRKAALLAIQCIRQINDRFGRASEIRAADIELSRWLKANR